MTLRHKAVDAIDEADLQALVDDEVAEDATIEYKAELPPNSTPDDKREFLFDVAAIANSSGGHIVYGIRAVKGVPKEVCGVGEIDVDSVKLALENRVRDGLRPRIAGLSIHAVPLTRGGVAIVLRIPRSWARPHMMVLRDGMHRFHGRNSAGRFPLDVDQIRDLAIGSAALVDRLRAFRSDRVASVLEGESPVPLLDGPAFVLHLVPFGAFDAATRVDLAPLERDPPYPGPGSGSYNHRFNFDGFVTFTAGRGKPGEDYLQVFRSGAVELVLVRQPHDRAIYWQSYERTLVEALLPSLLGRMAGLGIDPPIAVMLSLLHVRGTRIAVSRERYVVPEGDSIERDVLLVPEVVLEGFQDELAPAMRPAFDAVWNAAGWRGSLNYARDGGWLERGR